ncbi:MULTISPECIES: hypothetical protein [unclassified Treponema]|uniref:hypothetical protein n=1 Tax=unclassified Treponema TaxID=2638727 RepID=UPI0020A3504A|nr:MULTISPECIES: hypothetical protein [unclassified Treponema]UTC66021.1 hypothetical protein E4O06_08290 [Treponema sp. OMZ 789]UTC68751.1 hypothetical protein E4O01_08430 [Treponema sp. OMZ 790]UTC71480.1 hypothetical protein E4O02_08620 [Treponema sp. OMZ 791]
MEYFERIEIENNIITNHVIGEKPKQEKEGVAYIYASNIKANIGDDVRMYEDLILGKKKRLKKLVEENLIQIPEGKKLNKDGTDFEDMSEAEKVEAGLKTLKDDEKIEGDYVVKKTKKELYDEGKLSKKEYNLYIDELRQSAYAREADPLGMQVMRGDIEKNIWLEKIEEIKTRYPKVD